jgi:hypothetical protein
MRCCIFYFVAYVFVFCIIEPNGHLLIVLNIHIYFHAQSKSRNLKLHYLTAVSSLSAIPPLTHIQLAY